MGRYFLIALACVPVISAGCSKSDSVDPAVVDRSDMSETTRDFANIPESTSANVQLESTHSPRFVDRHIELGVNFCYDNGSDARALMVQSIGGGGAWVDFDRDGWQDLYLVQGGDPTGMPPHVVGDRIMRSWQGKAFSDTTSASLPQDLGYGQGVAVGDFDNDGFDDIFVTNTGPNVMLQNCGDGTFLDITTKAQVDDPRWGTSAAWLDPDADGDLDLFVCNYCRYDVFNPIICRKDDGTPAICHPEALDADYSECYENLGDGSFEVAGEKWGLAEKPGKALGVVAADFNEDGVPDLFVSNDMMANYLYIGQKGGGFIESAISHGCAYNTLGLCQANMGVACNDYDRNGHLDLYITTFTQDSNTLFANLGATGFRDVTRLEGLHSTTIETLGFGTVMADFDADGAMDLFMSNGHIDDWRDKNEMWKMPPELFTYLPSQRQWAKLTAESAGVYFSEEHLGRAVSMADIDRDGDADLLVVHQNVSAALLVNESEMGNWLQIECLGVSSNRHCIGAKVTVRQEKQSLVQQLIGGSSYLTTHEPLLFFGLGGSTAPCEVTVQWPDSKSPARTLTIEPNQRVVVVEPSLARPEGDQYIISQHEP